MLYNKLATALQARTNCINSKNDMWLDKWETVIDKCVSLLPHGSGIDGKTVIDFEKTTSKKIVLTTSYHFMNEHGFYDGWADLKIIVTPSFNGIDLKVMGYFPKKYSDLRSYIGDIFYEGFMQECNEKVTLL